MRNVCLVLLLELKHVHLDQRDLQWTRLGISQQSPANEDEGKSNELRKML